jgi:fructose-1-phosphate kinase PfkB-like protein
MPNPCFDLTFNIATLVPGSVHRSQSNSFSPGGKGINVARAAKTLGNSSQILVMLPEVEGEIYKKLLDSEGHQLTYQDIAGQVRHAILLNQNSPEANTVIVGKGPEMNSNDWQKFCDLVENLVQPNEIVVEMGSLPPNYPDNALEMLAQVIHSKGAKLLADTSPACLKTRGREILDFITPNLDEAEAFISNSSEAVYILSSEAIGMNKEEQNKFLNSTAIARLDELNQTVVGRAVPWRKAKKS